MNETEILTTIAQSQLADDLETVWRLGSAVID
jgi:hypothetical protein